MNKEIIKIITYIARTILIFNDYLKKLYYLVILLTRFDIILEIL